MVVSGYLVTDSAFGGNILRRLFLGWDRKELRFEALIHATLPRFSVSYSAWAIYVNCGYFRYQKSDLLIINPDPMLVCVKM
jgi:hypothetical protein